MVSLQLQTKVLLKICIQQSTLKLASWLAGVSPLAYSNTFKCEASQCEASQWPILGSSSLIRDQPEGTQDQEPRDY